MGNGNGAGMTNGNGQDAPLQVTEFNATYSGQNEVPPNNSRGRGSGIYFLVGVPPADGGIPAAVPPLISLPPPQAQAPVIIYSGEYTGLSSPVTTAQFHVGAEGTNGRSVKTVNQPVRTGRGSYRYSGVWRTTDTEPLTPALIAEFNRGNLYISIKTERFPKGEIRGQLMKM